MSRSMNVNIIAKTFCEVQFGVINREVIRCFDQFNHGAT
jgi:hypothetical protein